MSTLAESFEQYKKPWQWALAGGAILLVWAAVAIPGLHRSQESVDILKAGPMVTTELRMEPVPAAPIAGYASQDAAKATISNYLAGADAIAGRKIARTITLAMVVLHPGEIAQQITAMAENMEDISSAPKAGSRMSTPLRSPSASRRSTTSGHAPKSASSASKLKAKKSTHKMSRANMSTRMQLCAICEPKKRSI